MKTQTLKEHLRKKSDKANTVEQVFRRICSKCDEHSDKGDCYIEYVIANKIKDNVIARLIDKSTDLDVYEIESNYRTTTLQISW